MLTNGTGELPAEFWMETNCEKCGQKILRGDPRRIVAFLSLAYGPGSQHYQDEKRLGDECGGEGEDIGLENLRAITFCIPCSGEDAEIPNPWREEREQRVVDGPKGGVRAIPVSQMHIRIDEEVVGVEEQDAILSGFAPPAKMRVTSARRTRSQMSESAYRDRMARFLRANPSAMNGRRLQVCALWAEGKTQTQIERETGIDQSTVCRLVRSGKAMLG